MKLKELKGVIYADNIIIYIHNTAQRFCNEDDKFVFWADNSVNMWDIYGEDEVDKIYMDYRESNTDNEVICMDLK